MYIVLFLLFLFTKLRYNIDAIFAYLGESGSCFVKLFTNEVFNTKALTDVAVRP